MSQVFEVDEWLADAAQPLPLRLTVTVTPADGTKCVLASSSTGEPARFEALPARYAVLSEKYASSAVTRLRRSDFIDARYAFSFVLANFGIAIAARMPMMTTTINSSIRVKPLRFCILP